MNEFFVQYWPYFLCVFLAVVALVVVLRGRGQRVDLGEVDPVISSTLLRTDPVQASALPPLADDSELLRIKGLGPKVAARLQEVGIATLSDLAALEPASETALDAQLGPFAGRMTRDRWVEQARLLQSGDTLAFEAQFGKLG